MRSVNIQFSIPLGSLFKAVCSFFSRLNNSEIGILSGLVGLAIKFNC